MSRYSAAELVRKSFGGHRSWGPAWRNAVPRSNYDVIVIGGGGHGLATAYYLAKNHSIRRIAVLEKGWIGGGNTGRNTQHVRSNYFYPESAAIYEHSLKLYEGLARDINFNIMLSQRGYLTLAHSEHELELLRRALNAIQLNGIDAEEVSPADIKALEPLINLDACYPVMGGFIQKRAGIVRHDAVAWGYARAAFNAGVDIVENCEVTGFEIEMGRVTGVKTSIGTISAGAVGVAVAGHSSEVARLAGFRLPIVSMALQAMVTEPIKPALKRVILSPSVHTYVAQSDRGEIVIGGVADIYNSYAQRGGPATIEHVVSSFLELFPRFRRLKLMRQWAGIVDVTPDTSPILGETPIKDLYINCGWGTGGFKAIPGGGDTMAHTIAKGEVHPLIKPFGLDRFASGALIDERAASGVMH